MYVIIAHVMTGVIGPFSSEEEAIAYGKLHIAYGWYVRPVVQPVAQEALQAA